MGYSQYTDEQQAEAQPPRKYELPADDLKPGLFRRLTVGLLVSGVFLLLKDVLFNWGGPAPARADGAMNIDPGNTNIGPPSLVLVETSGPIDDRAPGQKPSTGSIRDQANAPNTLVNSLFSAEQPSYAEPGQTGFDLLPLPGDPTVGTEVSNSIASTPSNDNIDIQGGDGGIFPREGEDPTDGRDGDERMSGTERADVVFRGAEEGAIFGGEGDDQIFGTVLDGDGSYFGGAGTDTYDLSEAKAGAIVVLASGTPIVPKRDAPGKHPDRKMPQRPKNWRKGSWSRRQ